MPGLRLRTPTPQRSLDAAENFSAFDLEAAAEFAEKKNKAGFNIYVGAALRHGETRSGRASGFKLPDGLSAWAEFDKPGDDARINAILKDKNLRTAMIVVTGLHAELARASLFQARRQRHRTK